MITKPMACARAHSIADISFPCLATPKLDGIRCVKVGGKALTRRWKPVANGFVREQIEAYVPDGTDGELLCKDFSSTQSAICSYDGRPDFVYYVFDFVHSLSHPYSARAQSLTTCEWAPFVEILLPALCETPADLEAYEERCLEAGHEGVCTRSPHSPYKCGRSTLREQYLVKLKRYQDGEAVILGFEEAKENLNPPQLNAFGHIRRPGGSALKFPKGTLGNFVVRDVATGVVFNVGTGRGLTAALRQHIWDNREAYLGRIVTYCHQAVGAVEKPRFPSFKGFRDD